MCILRWRRWWTRGQRRRGRRAFGGPSAGGSGAGGSGAGGSGAGGSGASGSGASGSGAGGSGGALVQVHDGQRGRSFNDGWKFYLGDATGAQDPGFNDTTWTSLAVPHDWTPALGMSQSSPGGSGEG
jgi:hypothetical protein